VSEIAISRMFSSGSYGSCDLLEYYVSEKYPGGHRPTCRECEIVSDEALDRHVRACFLSQGKLVWSTIELALIPSLIIVTIH
jgi:hypothetical protein